ncbi:MAG: hypothetical protein ACRD2B_14035 [Terriglobia bacterium]
MKIDLNLAQPESRLGRWLFLWAPALIVLTLVLLIRVLMVAQHEFAVYRRTHASVLRYQAETGEMERKAAQARRLLGQAPTLKLYRQIGFLNTLIKQKRVSLSELTLEVTHLLPKQTRLATLSLAETEKGPVVELSVEGNGDKVVNVFLSRLESSPDFDAVTVTDQTFASQPQDKGLVILTCSAHYVGEQQARRDVKN